MDGWTPRKLVLASMGVAIFSSVLTGGVVVWLLSGKKPPEPPLFSPQSAIHPAETSGGPAAVMPPTDPVAAGNWHYDRQHWNEAIAAYENALRSGFDNPDVRTDLGNCYRFSNRPEAALEQYLAAQKQNPKHEHSLFNQASLYVEAFQNRAKAHEVAEQFLARFPESNNRDAVRKYLEAP